MRKLTKKERFNEKVLSKYNIYNSIFSTLPYENIYNTDICFLYFLNCVRAVMKKIWIQNPLLKAFNQYCSEYSEKDKFSLLFKFIQYVERQIVLLMLLKMQPF